MAKKFPKLTLKKMGGSWWIVGDSEDGPYGPYDTKKEAEEDRLGISRTMRNDDNQEYWTCDTDYI